MLKYRYVEINIKPMSSSDKIWNMHENMSECVFYVLMYTCVFWKGASNFAHKVKSQHTLVFWDLLLLVQGSLSSFPSMARQQPTLYKGTAGDVLPSVLAFFVPSDAASSCVWAREAATRHSSELCNRSTSLGLPCNHNPQLLYNSLRKIIGQQIKDREVGNNIHESKMHL